MSHRLEPSGDRPCHDPNEVALRLCEEFAYCDVDAEQGKDDVGDMIAKLIELNAPQFIIDDAMAGREQSLRITVADDTTSEDYLSFLVRPNEALLIGYRSGQHEAATRLLVERCARALDYEIFLV